MNESKGSPLKVRYLSDKGIRVAELENWRSGTYARVEDRVLLALKGENSIKPLLIPENAFIRVCESALKIRKAFAKVQGHDTPFDLDITPECHKDMRQEYQERLGVFHDLP
jgi:hypothetical protein